MAYEIPPEFTAELTDWTLHFLDQGDSPELAHEHASAAVAGIYLRDEAPVAVVERGAVSFVSHPPVGPHRQIGLKAFRWADVVPMPPGYTDEVVAAAIAAAATTGARPVDGEPHANSPTDTGGAQGGWGHA